MFHLMGAQVVDVCLVEEKVSWAEPPVFRRLKFSVCLPYYSDQIIFRWAVAIIEDLQKVQNSRVSNGVCQ